MSMSFSLGEGVKHKKLGLGLVINQEPDRAGNIIIKFENGMKIGIHPTELECWPTDMNGRLIKIGDDVLYPNKNGTPTYIGQGIVETIKPGKTTYRGQIIRLGVREDRTGNIKSVPDHRQCIVIDHLVIKHGY